MHAYWIYPKTLEINVWNTFERRARAIIRGKQYSNLELGGFYKPATCFEDLRADSSCFLLNVSSNKLPIPDNSIDVIVTDPPYGGNVNYGELSDFWWVWLQDKTVEKFGEAIINRSQNKSLKEYENILASVFKECFRVLKPGGTFVSTFNSKDARVVTSFIIALTAAGFKIINEAISYQNPIKAYSTTIHAMQIGAFAGDFIFTFTKPNQTAALTDMDWRGLPNFKKNLSQLISENLTTEVTEAQLREKAYKLMIPFIAGDSLTAPEICMEAADFFEEQIREHLSHFKNQRKLMIESRKKNFRATRVET
jgi:SAM-dependent methyltransferase